MPPPCEARRFGRPSPFSSDRVVSVLGDGVGEGGGGEIFLANLVFGDGVGGGGRGMQKSDGLSLFHIWPTLN